MPLDEELAKDHGDSAPSAPSVAASSTTVAEVVAFGEQSFTPDEQGRKNFMAFLAHLPQKFAEVFEATLITGEPGKEYVQLGKHYDQKVITIRGCDKGSLTCCFASACLGVPDMAGCRLKVTRLAGRVHGYRRACSGAWGTNESLRNQMLERTHGRKNSFSKVPRV